MEQVVTLDNIGNGAAKELFQRALDEVLANIADPNTEAEKKREIKLSVAILPVESRDGAREHGAFEIRVETKLVGPKPAGGTMYFGTVRGSYVAVQQNPRQAGLFDETPRPAVEPAGVGRTS